MGSANLIIAMATDCPFTMSTGHRCGICGDRFEPVTFQWIMQNDPGYAKSVLTRVRNLKSRNMQQFYMYLREHYEPESWKKWSALDKMEKQLAEWRHQMAEVISETHSMDACELEEQAVGLTEKAVRATADATRATAAAAWMTTEAARVTAKAARSRPSGSSGGEAGTQPQHKKAKI